ncbi:MAG TPA: alkaline phosphatase family protein [Dongiaceae bacterium]|nr:alkaline phosphatase family protein [Dongiaceae bacterium]
MPLTSHLRPTLLAVTAAALATILGACRAAGPHSGGAPPPDGRPALVVMITVDQLRGDLLDRYDSLFTGGFRRLHDRGLRFTRATVDHAITISHPGHVTLATGLVPGRHGIVDAAYYEGPAGARRFVDALEDRDARIIGAADLPGVSPRRILAPTLAEWTLAADPEARVAAIGSGQYSSLLHAGHARAEVYWYAAAAGRYVTSSAYHDEVAPWAARFNDQELPRFQDEAADWEVSVPVDRRGLANPDDAPGETDGTHRVFPHRLEDLLPAGTAPTAAQKGRWIGSTPYLDLATLGLARAAVDGMALGARGRTDLVSIVLSQVDEEGHWYGPLSLEQMDTLLRLDAGLGRFFDFLDATVGADRWIVALSADHGVTDSADRRAAGLPAARVGVADMRAVESAVAAIVKSGAGQKPDVLAARVAAAVRRFPFVADAMTAEELLAGPQRDPFRALYRSNVQAERIPRFPLFDFDRGTSAVAEQGVLVRLVEGAVPDLDPGVHGTPYADDRSVPILFMGPWIGSRASDEPARTIDVAPTLAALAGIPAPAELDGRNLLGGTSAAGAASRARS